MAKEDLLILPKVLPQSESTELRKAGHVRPAKPLGRPERTQLHATFKGL